MIDLETLIALGERYAHGGTPADRRTFAKIIALLKAKLPA